MILWRSGFEHWRLSISGKVKLGRNAAYGVTFAMWPGIFRHNEGDRHE